MWANPLKSWVTSGQKWCPTFAEKHNSFFGANTKNRSSCSLWEKFVGKMHAKTSRASWGKFGKRSFAPPKVSLFLHLCYRNPFYCALIALRQNPLFLSPLGHFQAPLKTYETLGIHLSFFLSIPPKKRDLITRVLTQSSVPEPSPQCLQQGGLRLHSEP